MQELSDLLKQSDVDPNSWNRLGAAPLHSLAKREFLTKSLGLDLLYTFLIESDVDIDLRDRSGNTALHFAVEVHYESMQAVSDYM